MPCRRSFWCTARGLMPHIAAADLVLDAQDQIGVLVDVDGPLQAQLAAHGLLETGARGESDVLHMAQVILALVTAESFRGSQALRREGLQKSDGHPLWGPRLGHGQSPLTRWASVGGATA